MANETLNFNIGGIDHPVKDPNAYVKPSTGIPKEHLSQSIQDSLELADSSLQPSDKTQLQGAITQLQNALNTLIGSGNVQGAIDTFNEVTAFLNGIDTDDPTLANQLNSLNNAITNLQTSLAGKISGIKANGASETLPVENGIVTLPPAASPISPATVAPLEDGTAGVGSSEKYAREDHVHPHDTTKQDTLTFDNVPTAGHTTQVMSSDKIKTALDNLLQNLTIGQNGNWYVGQTDTGVKAQGPQGNCTITDAEQMVSEIVNDLDTGGGNKFLSAEMGKKLKNAIVTIYNALGEYAFLSGKPTIDLNAVVAVQVSVGTHVSYTSSGDTVSMGAALNVQLSTDNNLYVIDDDEVTVEMGGIDITSTAYIAAQNKIVISSVTDTVVITVGDAITYVSDGLVCMFDGKNRGGVAGEWTDIKDNTRKLILSQCGEYDDHVNFNGTNSTALAADTTTGVDVGDKVGTIEWVSNGHVCDSSNTYLNIIVPHRYEVGGVQTPIIIGMAMYSSLFNNGIGLSNYQVAPNAADIPNSWLMGKSSIAESDALYISLSHTRAFKNGSTSLTRATQNGAKTYAGARANARFGILSYVKQDGSTASQKGNMYCMRIYSKTLDVNEVLQNYKVDKKRFNI